MDTQSSTPTASTNARVDACVILAGGIKPSPLERQAQRSVLDMWLGSRGTVLECWLESLATIHSPDAAVQVVHAADRAPTAQLAHDHSVRFSCIAEQGAYRGPAGVVRDCCQGLPPESVILIVEASRWAHVDLLSILKMHLERKATTTVCVNPNQSPSGVYLTQNVALDSVPRKGFMDIKEQWLPRVQQRIGGVFVHRVPAPGVLPVRTVPQALAVSCHDDQDATGSQNHPRCTQSTIAPDAAIDADAAIVQSIIMPGVRVEEGAVVVRSIVCTGAVVRRDARVLDEVYTAKPGEGVV